MNKKFYYFIIFLFLINCSLDTKTGIWSQSKDLVSENKNNKKRNCLRSLKYMKEFNKDLKIRLKENLEKKF